MASLNKFMGIGNLTKDVDVRYTQDGKCVASFTIAMNEKWKNKEGEPQEKAEFLRCTAWDRLGEVCGKYLSKGSSIYVEGKIRTKRYTKDDIERFSTEVEIREMQMLGSKNDSGNNSQDNSGQSENQNNQNNNQGNQNNQSNNNNNQNNQSNNNNNPGNSAPYLPQ